MRDEIAELRAAIIDLDAKLQGADDIDARFEEHAALREEMLMMRDTIVHLEAAYGEAQGQRAWYAAQLAGKEAAVEQLQAVLDSRTWRATKKLLAPYRTARRVIGR